MKLCFFNEWRLGVVKGDTVVDVTAVVSDIPHVDAGDLMNGLIAKFDQYKSKIEAAVANKKWEQDHVLLIELTSITRDTSRPKEFS